MEHLNSLEHYQAYIQLESDYRNLVVYNDEINNFRSHTRQGKSARDIAEKTLESIIENKKVLGINFDSDIELLTKIKFK